MKVLIVDDVSFTRLHLERVLQAESHTVVSVCSAAEALSAYREDPTFAVVITDLVMRGMDGVELFQQLQRMERITDEGLADPPAVVLLTAMHPGVNAQARDIERIDLARQLGFAEILYKPVDRELLIRTMKRLSVPRRGKIVLIDEPIRRMHEAVDALLISRDHETVDRLRQALVLELARLDAFNATEPPKPDARSAPLETPAAK
jgi:CheY-like chemotaxis protein